MVGMGKGEGNMNLRRYIPVKDGLEDAGLRMARFDDGEYVRYADVADAWAAKLAEIRAAVEAERDEAEDLLQSYDAPDTGLVRRPLWNKQDALDALLAVAVAPEAEVAP